jgi:hypothetical protein
MKENMLLLASLSRWLTSELSVITWHNTTAAWSIPHNNSLVQQLITKLPLAVTTVAAGAAVKQGVHGSVPNRALSAATIQVLHLLLLLPGEVVGAEVVVELALLVSAGTS